MPRCSRAWDETWFPSVSTLKQLIKHSLFRPTYTGSRQHWSFQNSLKGTRPRTTPHLACCSGLQLKQPQLVHSRFPSLSTLEGINCSTAKDGINPGELMTAKPVRVYERDAKKVVPRFIQASVGSKPVNGQKDPLQFAIAEMRPHLTWALWSALHWSGTSQLGNGKTAKHVSK